MKNKKIPLPDYIKGHEFTEKLKEVTGCSTFQELSEIVDVPSKTFSAWNLRQSTSFELILRLHMETGVSLEYLAFGKGEPFPNGKIESESSSKSQLSTVTLNSFCLSNGKLLPTGQVPYSERRINKFCLQNSDLIELETNESLLLIDKNEVDPVNGNYLISIDGRYSINQIQRLPGKLAINFDGSTIEVVDGDIEVVGKVVLMTEQR